MHVHCTVYVYSQVLSFTTLFCSLARKAIRGREVKSSFSSSFGNRYQRYRLLFSLLVARSFIGVCSRILGRRAAKRLDFGAHSLLRWSVPSLGLNGLAFLIFKQHIHFFSFFIIIACFRFFFFFEREREMKIIEGRSFSTLEVSIRVDTFHKVALIW